MRQLWLFDFETFLQNLDPPDVIVFNHKKKIMYKVVLERTGPFTSCERSMYMYMFCTKIEIGWKAWKCYPVSNPDQTAHQHRSSSGNEFGEKKSRH